MHNRRPLRIASTIGPIETGLLPALEGAYAARTAIPVEHEALGTGAALDRAKRGGIDIVIAHAPALEQRFIADGWGLSRHPFAANDFVIVGPASDPAGVRDAADALDALRRIADARASFLSRGDRSGTHIKEQELGHVGSRSIGIGLSTEWLNPAWRVAQRRRARQPIRPPKHSLIERPS